jgi:hypothetical protein
LKQQSHRRRNKHVLPAQSRLPSYNSQFNISFILHHIPDTLLDRPSTFSLSPPHHVSAGDDGSARQQTRGYKHGRAPLAAWLTYSVKATRLYRHAIHATEAF